MKETTARSASGWSHSYDWFGPTSQPTRRNRRPGIWNVPAQKSPKTMEELQSLIQNKSAITRYIRVRCPDCGAVATNGEFPLSPKQFHRQTPHLHPLRIAALPGRTPPHGFSETRQLQAYAKRERSARDMLQRGMQPIESKIKPDDRHGYARYPLATYINRHYKRRLDLLIADECHQYKAI